MGVFEASESGPAQIMLETGNAVEDAIAEQLAKRHAKDCPGRYVHGLELEKDGIYGTIDLFDCVDSAVEDIKLTKKSIRHEITSQKYWHNWKQVQTYCYMIGSNIGRLHIVYVNGNYKFEGEKGWDLKLSGWQYRLWEDVWTNEELEKTWRMVHGHRLVGGGHR